jgi:type I restriction enzyme R subunit
LVKLTAMNHHISGLTNALKALGRHPFARGKLRVFWHTQGSGKSVAKMYFAQK